MIAVILSLIFPGSGQIYYGHLLKGLTMILLSFTFLYPIVLIWSVWDAWNLRKTGKADPTFRKESFKGLARFSFVSFLVMGIIFFFGYWLINPYVKKSKTQHELKEISTALDQYFSINKSYPENLDILTLNRPLRKDWTHDAWNNRYIYSPARSKSGTIIASAGKDGKMGTKDDIRP